MPILSCGARFLYIKVSRRPLQRTVCFLNFLKKNIQKDGKRHKMDVLSIERLP